MGKLLHDRLTIFAQRKQILWRRTLLTLGTGSPESGQMVCAGKGEPEMAKVSKCAISCMRLTSKFLVKYTLEREQ